MSAAIRNLSEPEVVRLLDAGGMLAETGDGWRAFRRRDARKRPAGGVARQVVERMKDEGHLAELSNPGGRWVSRAGLAAEAALPARPAHLTYMTAPRPRRTPLILSLLTETQIDPAEAARLKAAGQRFLSDLEQAATPQRITMRWDGLPSEPGAKYGGSGPVQPASAAAMARLRQLERAIGAAVFRRAEALLADRASRRTFANLCGCPPREAEVEGLDCLRHLARAYALDVRAPR